MSLMKLFNKIISDPFRIVLSGTLVKIFEISRGLLVLRYLSLEEYSIISLINQIKTFTKYGNIGFLDVVRNEYNYEGIKDKSKAKGIFNVGLTADFFIQLLLALSIICFASFSGYDFIIKIGLIFSAFNYLLLKIWSYYELDATLNKSYKQLSRILILSSSSSEILTIAFLFVVGIWSPLLVPPFSLFLVIFLYYKRKGKAFQIKIDFKEMIRQFKKGILLSLLTILTGICFVIERKITINLLGIEKFGFFGLLLFIFGFIRVAHKNFNLPNTVLNREYLATQNYKKVLQLLFKRYFVIAFFLCPFMIFFGSHILTYILENFLEKYVLIVPVLSTFLLYAINKLLINHFGYILYAEGVFKLSWMYIILILEVLTLSLGLFFGGFSSLLEIVQFLAILSATKAFIIIFLTQFSLKVNILRSIFNALFIVGYPQIIFYAIQTTYY